MATVYKYPQWLMPENSNQSKVSNYSFEFDGVDDHISLPDIPFLRGGGQHFSISAWVYHTAIGQGGYFGSRVAPSSTNTINFYRNTNGSAVLVINNSSTGNIERRSSNSSITTNNWHHIVATFDGTQTDAADRVNIYVDGVLDNGYQSGTGTNLPSGSTGIYNFLGRIYLGVRQTGKIDNLAIWDSTLTAGNVTTLYNGGKPVDVTTLSPSYAWKLGEAANFTDNWLVNNSALSNYSTRSFSFDGVDDYVNCGSSITNLQTGDISFSTWIYPTSFSSYNYFLDSGSITTKKGVFAGLQITTGFVALARKTAVTDTRCNTGWVDCGLTINNWYNIVGVYDEDGGTAGVGQLKLYVNGVLKATVDGSGQDTSAGYDLYIGKSENNFSHFIGNIDEVSFYDYPLTSGNVTTIYNSGSPENLISLSPTSWWRMGEDATFSTNWSLPDNGSGSSTGTSANMDLADLEGDAPNYTGGGLSANMTIEDRVGNAPNSNNNALSYNMDEVDRETDVPKLYFLDTYGTNIGGAYSFRKLSRTYSGSCIRVRRSSDNAEADIGFSGDYLDETALLAHTGTSGTDTGYIVKWYDQSGAFTGYAAPNLNDGSLTMATTSYQPIIVNAGAVIKGNGLAKAGGTNRVVMSTPLPGGNGNGWISNWGVTLTEFTCFNVAYTEDVNYYDSWLGSIASGGTVRGAMGISQTANPRYLTLRSQAGAWSAIITGTTAITYDQFHLATGVFRTNPNTTSLALDGVAQGSVTTFTPAVMNNLTWPGGASGWSPDSSEWIFYKTPPSASDIAAIEANIMEYYGIS